jgi:RNA polymerase sigma-70 factor (ECF subfamily)
VSALIARGEPSIGSLELARVAAAQTGDEASFEALIQPRLVRLLRLSLSILGNEADAQDAVQDACLQAWSQLSRLRDPERFEAWLWQIAINGCRTRLRRRRDSHVREISVDDMLPGQEPAHGQRAPGEDLSEIDAIRRAFARLDPDKRAILVLHHVEHRSIVDISALLDIPDGTAKWRLYAARRALEHALEEEAR